MQLSFDPLRYKYRAFLSYARINTGIVDDLFSRLQRYRTPSKLLAELGEYGRPPRSIQVFVDRKSAQLGASVPDRLIGALAESAFLIVLCSAAAKQSLWVNREVATFLKSAPPNRVLPVFVRAHPTEALADLLPDALAQLGDALPFGADLLVDGGPGPVSHKVIGALLGFPQDRIAREQERADRRRRTLERSVFATITALSTGAAAAGWIAFNESQKARQSLDVALGALDKTTPFAARLLAEGRVTTAEAETFSAQLKELFASFSPDALRRSPDLSYSVGQIMTTAAHLHNVSGASSERAQAARRSFELLKPFASDGGPTPQNLLCTAALEAGAAVAEQGGYAEGRAFADQCDAVAAEELRYHTGKREDLAILAGQRVRAQLLSARLFEQESRFSEAFAAVDAALDDGRMGAVQAFSDASPQTATLLQAEGAFVRATILEAMESFAEASNSYEQSLQLYKALDISQDDLPVLILGRLRTLNAMGARDDAITQVEVAIRVLAGRIDRDPAQRGLKASLAQFYAVKAEALTGMTQHAAALVALQTAGSLNAELLAFDPANRFWIAAEAGRLLQLADLQFRQHETFGASSSLCRDACLGASRQSLESALKLLARIKHPTESVRRLNADLLIQLARTLRSLDDDEAASARLLAAEALVGPPRADDGELQRQLILARISDERADLLVKKRAYARAIDLYRQSLVVHQRAAEREPRWIAPKRDGFWTLSQIASTQRLANDLDSARVSYGEACSLMQGLGNIRSDLLDRDRRDVAKAAIQMGVSCGQ